MKFLVLVSSIIILSSCATSPKTPKEYLDKQGLGNQSPEYFRHCHGHGCRYKENVQFDKNDWAPIYALFSPLPDSAKQERVIIKQAIAFFEQRVGALSGTANDLPATRKLAKKYQLDCVDESTNTTIYLTLLEQKGFIRHHVIAAPSRRIPIIHSGRWPHQTAVIIERTSRESFVVDSWFHGNGIPPEIVTLESWMDGWNPSKIISGDTSSNLYKH